MDNSLKDACWVFVIEKWICLINKYDIFKNE